MITFVFEIKSVYLVAPFYIHTDGQSRRDFGVSVVSSVSCYRNGDTRSTLIWHQKVARGEGFLKSFGHLMSSSKKSNVNKGYCLPCSPSASVQLRQFLYLSVLRVFGPKLCVGLLKLMRALHEKSRVKRVTILSIANPSSSFWDTPNHKCCLCGRTGGKMLRFTF